MRNSMTCDGGGSRNYHPSGLRPFTLREFAALQTFPSHHQFEWPYIKKQIGNAFPCAAVEWLYRHILTSLLKADGMDGDAVDEDGDVVMIVE